jgi:hypothetical protein
MGITGTDGLDSSVKPKAGGDSAWPRQPIRNSADEDELSANPKLRTQ